MVTSTACEERLGILDRASHGWIRREFGCSAIALLFFRCLLDLKPSEDIDYHTHDSCNNWEGRKR